MENKRRKTIKVVTLGGVVITASQLPKTWSRPMVKSVLLPAHAQTSQMQTTQMCLTSVTSSPSSLSVTALAGAPDSDLDGINILFNGCDSLQLSAGDEPSVSGDRLLFLDSDSDDSDTFDIEVGPGGNWTLLSSTSAIPISDQPEGSYMLQVSRTSGVNAGTVFDVQLTVTVVDVMGGVEMTVSSASATIAP